MGMRRDQMHEALRVRAKCLKCRNELRHTLGRLPNGRGDVDLGLIERCFRFCEQPLITRVTGHDGSVPFSNERQDSTSQPGRAPQDLPGTSVTHSTSCPPAPLEGETSANAPGIANSASLLGVLIASLVLFLSLHLHADVLGGVVAVHLHKLCHCRSTYRTEGESQRRHKQALTKKESILELITHQNGRSSQ